MTPPEIRTDRPATRRRTARWGPVVLLLIAAALAIRLLGPQTVGETVRRQVCRQLRRHYPNLRITIGRGIFDPHRGLVLDNITFRRPGGWMGRTGPVIAHVDRLIAAGTIDLQKIRRGNPVQIQQMTASGIDLNVWQTGDSHSLAALLPMPQTECVTPRIDLRNVRVHLWPAVPSQRDKPIDWTCSQATVRQSMVDGNLHRHLIAAGSAEMIDRWRVTADCTGTTEPDVRAAIAMQNVSIDSVWLSRLPPSIADPIRPLGNLRCVANVDASVRYRGPNHPLDYAVQTELIDGGIGHPKLPMPIAGLTGSVLCTPAAVRLTGITATLGGSKFRVDGRINDLRQTPAIDVQLGVDHFRVDRSLIRQLPPPMQTAWDRLRLQGTFDAAVRIRRPLLAAIDHPTQIDGRVTCRDAEVDFFKFPHPVTAIGGDVTIADGRMQTDSLRGRFGGQTMTCGFDLPLSPKIAGPPPSPRKSMTVVMDGPVAINAAILDALTPRGQPTTAVSRFARQLSPGGSGQLNVARFETDAAGQTHRRFDISIVGGQVRYAAFPYPIYNVHGRIVADDNEISIEDFSGTNAGGSVRCRGHLHLANPAIASEKPEGGQNDLRLAFRVDKLPMDARLRSALPPQSRRVWDSIAPAGILDRVDVDLRRRGDDPLLMNVTARQTPRQNVTTETLSLRPASLPYQLNLTSGVVHYDGLNVRIENITGTNDGSRLAAAGRCYIRKDGRWVLAMDVLGGSRLVPDAELINSLPQSMRGAMRSLQLRGPVNVRGHSDLILPDENHDEPIIDWDLVLALEGNRIGDNGPIHAIRGDIDVRGRRDATMLTAEGNVNIDSMHVYDQQITAVEGPFRIVDETLTVGSQTIDGQIGRAVRGRLFGGTVGVDGQVELGSGNFNVAMSLRDAGLSELLLDFGYGDRDLTGAISGNTRLRGNLGTIELLKGDGTARVTGANLYELPLLIQVFNQLRISPSPKNAFTDARMEFSLFADHVTMRQLQIWGDLVSLHGGGTLNRRRELDLTFNTQVSPQNIVSRAIRPLRDSRYTLWTVEVRGPLSNPTIEKTALDGMGQTLDRWFSVNRDAAEDQATDTRDRRRTGLFSRLRR